MIDGRLWSSLISAVFVGAAAASLGSLMITRRMALVSDALGHMALPGMGLALLLKTDPSLGALVTLALGITILWRLNETTLLSLETLAGVLFVTSLSLGFLIIPQPELLETLTGDIARVGPREALVSVLVSLGVYGLVRRIYPAMTLLQISPDLAFTEGIRSRTFTLLFLVAIALTVAIGVRITGSLLVGALVIIPPASARLLSRELREYRKLSVGLGGASSFFGILISKWLRFPPGPSIILVSAAQFAVAIAVRRVRARVKQ